MRALFRLAPLMAFGPWCSLWAAEPSISLDLARVRQLAEERAPRSARARLSFDLASAQARRDLLGVPLVPALSAAPGLCLSGGAWFCGEVSVAFPLPLPGERSAARRVGEMGEGSAQVEVEAARASAKTEAGLRYLELLAERALRELAEEAARLAQAQLDAQGLRVRAGDASDLDRLQAAETLSRRLREVSRARADEQAALDSLRRALLLPGRIEISERLPAAVGTALRLVGGTPSPAHPKLAAARARVHSDVARADLAAALRWPRLALQGTYQNEPGLHAFFVGITIPLTGLSSVARADLALARAQQNRSEREADLLAREIEIARDAAGRRLERVRALREAAVEATARQRAVLALLRRGHAQKQLDLFRVLLAEEALLGSSREEIRAEHAVGRAALLVAAGGTP